MLRLPDGMRDRLKAAAAENNRSMNAEIVARLEETFSPFGKIPDTYADALQAHGGDVHALLATESVRIRALLEKFERDEAIKAGPPKSEDK